MTKAQFITAIEANPRFIKWASQPALASTAGEIETWVGKAFVTMPDGNYVDSITFFVDKATGVATWAGSNQIDSESNTLATKYKVLKNYLSTTLLPTSSDVPTLKITGWRQTYIHYQVQI